MLPEILSRMNVRHIVVILLFGHVRPAQNGHPLTYGIFEYAFNLFCHLTFFPLIILYFVLRTAFLNIFLIILSLYFFPCNYIVYCWISYKSFLVQSMGWCRPGHNELRTPIVRMWRWIMRRVFRFENLHIELNNDRICFVVYYIISYLGM